MRSIDPATRFIPGTVLHSILRVGAAFGIDASAVFTFAGLPVDLAALGHTWVTTAQFDRLLMDGLEATSGDPAFALHVGEMFNLLDLAILTTLVNTSRNLGEAAGAFARFRGLFHPFFHATITRGLEGEEDAAVGGAREALLGNRRPQDIAPPIPTTDTSRARRRGARGVAVKSALLVSIRKPLTRKLPE